MKYISFTYVDSVTGASVAKIPAANGPKFPDIKGLQFVRARESRYPTATPEFFGVCDDDADLEIPGVLAAMDEARWRAAVLTELREQATAVRWSVMTGGMELPGGIRVGTTIDDQNRITSVVANAALAGLADEDEVDFKSLGGWIKISIGQVKVIAGAIGQHVQACYTAERAHHEAIDLLDTPTDMNEYNVYAGWPDLEPEPETT